MLHASRFKQSYIYNIMKALTLVLMSGCIITAKEYAQLLCQSEYVVLALYTFITLQCKQAVCLHLSCYHGN